MHDQSAQFQLGRFHLAVRLLSNLAAYEETTTRNLLVFRGSECGVIGVLVVQRQRMTIILGIVNIHQRIIVDEFHAGAAAVSGRCGSTTVTITRAPAFCRRRCLPPSPSQQSTQHTDNQHLEQPSANISLYLGNGTR